MRRSLIIVLCVVLILVAAVAGFVAYEYEQPASTNVVKGTHNILLLCDDPTEDQGTEGIGSVDMAFAVTVVDGKVKNITSIYPGGLRSATYTEPSELGSGMLLLHDSLYGVSTEEGAKRAQEIVEHNKGIKTDAVIMATPDAINALFAAVGPIEVNGKNQTVTDSIGYIRNMTEVPGSTETRGPAVHDLMDPLIKAAESNPATYAKLASVVVDQYSKGNIRVVPKDLITQFAVANGLKVVT